MKKTIEMLCRGNVVITNEDLFCKELENKAYEWVKQLRTGKNELYTYCELYRSKDAVLHITSDWGDKEELKDIHTKLSEMASSNATVEITEGVYGAEVHMTIKDAVKLKTWTPEDFVEIISSGKWTKEDFTGSVMAWIWSHYVSLDDKAFRCSYNQDSATVIFVVNTLDCKDMFEDLCKVLAGPGGTFRNDFSQKREATPDFDASSVIAYRSSGEESAHISITTDEDVGKVEFDVTIKRHVVQYASKFIIYEAEDNTPFNPTVESVTDTDILRQWIIPVEYADSYETIFNELCASHGRADWRWDSEAQVVSQEVYNSKGEVVATVTAIKNPDSMTIVERVMKWR